MAIRGLRLSDVDAVATMLGQAFFDDPGAVFVEPDVRTRAAANAAVFAAVLGHVIRVGDASTTDELDGVAAWLPPDHVTPTPDDLMAAGFDRAIDIMGAAATARMATMGAAFETVHAAAVAGSHWRLELLGVAPERQRRGIASALIAPGHARADERGEQCYLETFTDADVLFYRRHGYRVAVEKPLSGTEVMIRGMVRPARVV